MSVPTVLIALVKRRGRGGRLTLKGKKERKREGGLPTCFELSCLFLSEEEKKKGGKKRGGKKTPRRCHP